MTIDLFIPILRQILAGLAGILVGYGYFNSSAADAFVGLGVNAFTLFWWLYDRRRINRRNAAVHEIAKDAIGPAAVKELVKNA